MDNNSCIRQQADIKQINRCKDRVSELNGSFDYLSNGLELAGNNIKTVSYYTLEQAASDFVLIFVGAVSLKKKNNRTRLHRYIIRTSTTQ